MVTGARIALGTVQFGVEYGISNTGGKVAAEEVASILSFSRDSGLDMLDTAIAYGDSEAALGRNNLSAFQVVSKLPGMPDATEDVDHWVSASLSGSLARLGCQQLYGLLLHRPGQLLEPRGPQLYEALARARQSGLVRNIGVSVYSPEELEQLTARYRFDLVQIPFNVLDQRLLTSGALARLKASGTEVHVRSLFLQGLLLMEPALRPQKFAPWASWLHNYDVWLTEQGYSPLEGCLRAAAGVAGIDRLVVGVDSLDQLQQITRVMNREPVALPSHLSCTDERLLNPGNWGIL